ncbi:MAG: NADAR domain-containing protein [Pseudomonadota bacterium]
MGTQNQVHLLPTSDHFYLYQKLVAHGKRNAAFEILHKKSPKAAKALAKRALHSCNTSAWYESGAAVSAMRDALMSKFSNNEKARETLLNTAPRIIAECCGPRDLFWGNGIDLTPKIIPPPYEWPGKNMLGKCLMEIRDKFSSS